MRGAGPERSTSSVLRFEVLSPPADSVAGPFVEGRLTGEVTDAGGDATAEVVGGAMQHPILGVLEGGISDEPALWDARAELDVGLFIERYLCEHPPPSGAVFAPEFECWSSRLQSRGRERLAELGASRLRAV